MPLRKAKNELQIEKWNSNYISVCNNSRRILKNHLSPLKQKHPNPAAEFVFDLPQSIKNLSKFRFIDPWVRSTGERERDPSYVQNW